MHLEAIDVDLWYVIKNGVPKAGEGVLPLEHCVGFSLEEERVMQQSSISISLSLRTKVSIQ